MRMVFVLQDPPRNIVETIRGFRETVESYPIRDKAPSHKDTNPRLAAANLPNRGVVGPPDAEVFQYLRVYEMERFLPSWADPAWERKTDLGIEELVAEIHKATEDSSACFSYDPGAGFETVPRSKRRDYDDAERRFREARDDLELFDPLRRRRRMAHITTQRKKLWRQELESYELMAKETA